MAAMMTDEQFMQMGATPSQPTAMSDEDFMNMRAPTSFNQDVAANEQAGIEAAKNFATLNLNQKPSTDAQENLRRRYQSGTAGREDYERAFMEGVSNSPPGELLSAVGALPGVNEVGTAVNKYVNPAISKATGLTPEEVGAAEMALPFARGPIGKITSPLVRPATESLAASADANRAAAMSENPFITQKSRNIDYVEGVNANAANMQRTYDAGYNKAREISQGITRNEPQLQQSATKLLDDLNDDPAHNGAQGTSQAYRDLNSVVNSFDDKGNIPLDSITLLQRRVNDLYSPDMSDTRKAIYNTLNSQLKKATARASDDNPEWGAMMNANNKLFQNYKDTYIDDARSDPIWSYDDRKDYEDAKSTNADPYGMGTSTATREKIYGMASNVKNMAQYESMMRKLPTSLQDSFTQDVIAANSNKEGSGFANNVSKIYYAYKAVQGSPWGAYKTLYNVMQRGQGNAINPALAEGLPHVEDATNHWGRISDENYQHWVDRNGGPNFSFLGQKSLPAPSTLALPAPQTPFKSDWAGNVSPMSAEDIARAEANRQAWPSVTPGEAQPTAAHGDIREPMTGTGQWQRDFMREHKGRPMLSTVGQEYTSPSEATLKNIAGGKQGETADEILEEFNDKFPGYKRGGRVPTEAQKRVGNYKKDHMRIHGMDISIENPKGSIRSGKTKDGKEWHVRMPIPYGYIRKTVGADGDHLDCFIGPHKNSNRIYVIDQKNLDDKKFDEHKALIGFSSRDEAIAAYHASFSDGKGRERIGHIRRLSVREFKEWLKHSDTTKPIKNAA